MKNKLRSVKTFLTFAILFQLTFNLQAQDKNFHIYLCFGQSNMEGQGTIEAQDLVPVERFKVFQSLDCPNLQRSKGKWYPATPPTCQCYSRLSPADYFGRTMVENLPENVTIGVINVAIGGCDIRIFDKDLYQDYDSTYEQSWFTDKVAAYGGNPYKHLIELAKLAQKDGVIKGILLHQGETNTGQVMWPSYVRKIYNDMLKDLSLKTDQVPLLAGEVYQGPGNCCSQMNSIINTLPDSIKTAHVISSKGCTGYDNAHFDSEGYRMLGRRYAAKMLTIMGNKSVYAEAECGKYGKNWVVVNDNYASNAAYITGMKGLTNTSTPPVDKESMIKYSFSVNKDSIFFIYGLFNNAGNKSNAIWIKVDNGPFELIDNLNTDGWQWLAIKTLPLKRGSHNITISIAEEGVKLDKLVFKNSEKLPEGKGEEAVNLCKVK